MTIAVDLGRKATKQTNNAASHIFFGCLKVPLQPEPLFISDFTPGVGKFFIFALGLFLVSPNLSLSLFQVLHQVLGSSLFLPWDCSWYLLT